MKTPPNKRLQRTRRYATSLVSCVGEPLKRNVSLLSEFDARGNSKTVLRRKDKCEVSRKGFEEFDDYQARHHAASD
jgi:hypothetical protein